MIFPHKEHEAVYWKENKLVAGIDEAGRGPLAGPVVAAAVIFEPETNIAGLNDSKKLSEKARQRLAELIYQNALDVSVGIIHAGEIDELNILQASVKAMKQAVEGLRVVPHHLLIDGNYFPEYEIPYTTIVKGDASSVSIAAASVIAKVTRDEWMINNAAKTYPQYGFEKHKGYATESHYEALQLYGITPIHRRSFLNKFLSGQMMLF